MTTDEHMDVVSEETTTTVAAAPDPKHLAKIAEELKLREGQVLATVGLLDNDATVPFISRYRKEVTGSLDEVAVMAIRDRIGQLRELDKRREAILKSLEDQGKLTDELREQVEGAETLTKLEDIYLPYRPKRRTRGTIAKEKGLEPLAEKIFAQDDFDVAAEAAQYVDAEEEVKDAAAALAGARDIIAEWVNEDTTAREQMRGLYKHKALFISKVSTGKETEGAKFKDYFDWEEPVAKAPSHRVLAMRRGEAEGILSLRVVVPEEEALALLARLFVKAENGAGAEVTVAIADCFKRLLSISMATEVRLESKKRADAAAVEVFAENLRQLLLAAPLGQKAVMGIDPGFRTGCKVVCLDRQGKLLGHDVIYLPEAASASAAQASGAKVLALCEKFKVEAIAIGNGTASRETETFVRSLQLPKEIAIVLVSEAGASVYSASEAARDEFAEYDLTVRGAVSIGRRLMDPLAELVKIDPKSIGVGQYQHDVDQTMLRGSLDDVVVSCVNNVGVEVNTASKQLLSYVSGLGPTLAQNIIEYRNTNGAFASRKDILRVPRLGPKAFEQAAGFLRIRDGVNPLDASAVHPESYAVVDAIAADLQHSVAELMRDQDLQHRINPQKYVSETVGLPTLTDICAELAKPGRDPREKFEAFSFSEGVHKLEDVQVGMTLPGIVTNVTAFGAFVDVGVHQDGLVHISQLADRYVADPNEVVKVHQQVEVTVLEVDLERKRIAMSMRKEPNAKGPKPQRSNEDKPTGQARPAPRPQQGQRPSQQKKQRQRRDLGGGTNLGDLLAESRKKR